MRLVVLSLALLSLACLPRQTYRADRALPVIGIIGRDYIELWLQDTLSGQTRIMKFPVFREVEHSDGDWKPRSDGYWEFRPESQ